MNAARSKRWTDKQAGRGAFARRPAAGSRGKRRALPPIGDEDLVAGLFRCAHRRRDGGCDEGEFADAPLREAHDQRASGVAAIRDEVGVKQCAVGQGVGGLAELGDDLDPKGADLNVRSGGANRDAALNCEHFGPLGKNEKVFAVIAYVMVVAVAYGLTRVLSGRAAYIHVGAMFGTIMAANVWMRILPAQQKMIEAIKEGRKPDDALSAQAKFRSKQNTFMAVPVVFLMISNHFPGVAYGDKYNWVILAVLVLLGWGAAKFIRRA